MILEIFYGSSCTLHMSENVIDLFVRTKYGNLALVHNYYVFLRVQYLRHISGVRLDARFKMWYHGLQIAFQICTTETNDQTCNEWMILVKHSYS